MALLTWRAAGFDTQTASVLFSVSVSDTASSTSHNMNVERRGREVAPAEPPSEASPLDREAQLSSDSLNFNPAASQRGCASDRLCQTCEMLHKLGRLCQHLTYQHSGTPTIECGLWAVSIKEDKLYMRAITLSVWQACVTTTC